jgi:uncharacterized membrane protein
MSHTCQPPDNKKNSLLEKPGDEQKPSTAKTNQDENVKHDKRDEANPPQETEKNEIAKVKQPELPFHPPPGAAQGVPVKQPVGQHQIGAILEPALWLVGILALGALIIAWLKKNREKQVGTVALTAHDQLSTFRQALEEGEMTDEEFKKVKALLAEKIHKPAKVAKPGTETEQESQHLKQEPSS